jgi:exosortase A
MNAIKNSVIASEAKQSRVFLRNSGLLRRFASRNDDQGNWRGSLQILGAAWAALLLVFWRDAADMAAIWWNSSTFNHCLIIAPVIGWLVMQRKDQLLQLRPQGWWPALLYVGAGAGGWLLGDAAGVALARQAGLVMMLQGSVAAVLGANVARGLLFPLFYMFFLVPFGEEFVPILQTLTAKMCMLMLAWAGIPAHIDGIFITTPGGYFKVAEACSGVKFLVAMVAIGALVSNLCFTRWSRRIAFMAACIIVPIIANGLRAFGTIYIAQSQGIQFAASFDHVFYGWIFFAIVIALTFGMGWRFFDKRADAPAFDPDKLQSPTGHSVGAGLAFALVLAIAALPALWSAAVAGRGANVPARIYLPEVKGWAVVSYTPAYPWKPKFDGNNHNLLGRYRSTASGAEVDMFIAVYDRQSEGRELVGYGQGAVDPDSRWAWTENLPAPDNAKAERITAPGPVAREVISYYRVDGVTTGSATKVKLATMKARLLGRNQQAVAVLVSAELQEGKSPQPALDAFIKDLGDIDKMADRMAGLD